MTGRDVQLGFSRTELLARLGKARAGIVMLIAPAGFGKSTLVRQYLQTRERFGVCDCAGVGDDLELARRIVPALADECPERSTLLTQRELLLGDGGTSAADRVALALETWKTPPQRPSAFVFENAEHLTQAGAREFFAKLLSRRPAERTLVICSREPLRFQMSRFAAPHEILTLRAGDLAFAEHEIREIFAPASPAAVERLLTISQGWPIAVLLLKRFMDEGRGESVLDSLNDIAFEELHDYLADQVLSSLDPAVVDALFACACIPAATDADLAVADVRPAARAELARLASESQFVQRTPRAEYVIHPLLGSLLLEHREAERTALLERTAAEYIANGNALRASELHLARGDQAAAARALGQYEIIADHAPSMQYSRVLASLDRALVLRYPRLWGVTALLRIFTVETSEILDEAETLWRILPPSTPPIERFYIFVFRVIFMSYLGMFVEAKAMVDEFAAKNVVPDDPQTPFHAYVLYMRGLITARLGLLERAEQDLLRALPICESMDVLASGALVTLAADIARVRGERALERQFIERAMDYARHSVLQNFVAFDLAEATFGAWLAGDDQLFAHYAVQLDERARADGIRAFSFFAARARGRPEEPGDVDLLKWVICGRLIAAAGAGDVREARRQAGIAFALAGEYHVPFLSVICAVAVGILDPLRFEEMMQAAEAAAATVESKALRSAVRFVAQRQADFGMLDAFVKKRLRGERAEATGTLEIHVLSGTVRSMGQDVQLSEREAALLFALATRREPMSRDQLLEALWPESDEYAARNALSVCLHRLRQHLGNEQAVTRGPDGYALADFADVDLWDVERIVSTLRARESLGDTDRTILEAAYRRLCAKRPERMESWSWFEPIERHLRELRLEVAQQLAKDALHRNDIAGALALADAMIAYDPCDEPAREIAITAYLARGDRAAALRHYRQYRETLAAELQCEPSSAITDLVRAQPRPAAGAASASEQT